MNKNELPEIKFSIGDKVYISKRSVGKSIPEETQPLGPFTINTIRVSITKSRKRVFYTFEHKPEFWFCTGEKRYCWQDWIVKKADE